MASEARPASSIQEINDISEEISARGHAYNNRVVSLEKTKVPSDIALRLGSKPGAEAFQSVLVHFEDGVPVQLENDSSNQRWFQNI